MAPSMKFDPRTDLVDLKGKVAIVTGSNSGIGFETVRFLARAGAKVYLAARNESRATGAIAALEHDDVGPGEIHWLKLDLSDPRDAKKSAEEFLSREKRLDILINNAANVAIGSPQTLGRDGISNMVVTNYISAYIFTKTLLQLLQQTAREPNSDVRIVNVSSLAIALLPSSVTYGKKEDWNNAFPKSYFSGLVQYGFSKLMQISWSKTLQRRLNEDTTAPITVIALHPGTIDTFTHKWRFAAFWKFIYSWFSLSVEQGAYNSLFAGAGKRVADDRKTYHGAWLEARPTGRIATPNKDALDEVQGEELWASTEEFLQSIGL